MPTMTAHAPGTFCWVDLAAHDVKVAEQFYTALFGWTAEHTRFGPDEGDVYVMLRRDGQDAAALYPMDPTQRSQGVPSSWLNYVAVESAAQAASRTRELGGTVLADAFEVMDLGRMALLSDPTGAVFAAWEAGNHIGAGVRDETGAMCWNELGTRDTDRAGEFYAGLFGWEPRPFDGGNLPYTMFMRGDARTAGMYRVTPDMGDMPTAWAPYFAVDDTDDATRRAEALGARVLHPPFDLTVGRWALLQDPQGALFNIIRPVPRGA